jgi:hypothetical protein
MDGLEKALAHSLLLSWWQQLGLAFLLGSFTVATLSDLKHLSAQREFLEVWILFLLGVLGFELYDLHVGRGDQTTLAVKWGLIALLSVLSLARVGVLFRLAIADVAALAAAASLLPPVLILIFYAIAKLLSWPAAGIVWAGRPVYPFMPVISLATLAVLALGLVW